MDKEALNAIKEMTAESKKAFTLMAAQLSTMGEDISQVSTVQDSQGKQLDDLQGRVLALEGTPKKRITQKRAPAPAITKDLKLTSQLGKCRACWERGVSRDRVQGCYGYCKRCYTK